VGAYGCDQWGFKPEKLVTFFCKKYFFQKNEDFCNMSEIWQIVYKTGKKT
jgi:hypothetical protein